MIKGCCRTNLDEYRGEHWPDRFVAIPRMGDRVASESGKCLYVCGITHKTKHVVLRYEAEAYGHIDVNCEDEPYVEVELTKAVTVSTGPR